VAGPFLIAGLGNPGSEYANTLHNLGFQVIDVLAKRWFVSDFKKKFRGLLGESKDKGALLLKPQTFMNLSGISIGEVASFYKLDPATQILVIVDELDLPPGHLRLKPNGSSGGHNGLKSVIESLGTENFYRLRIGIGRMPGTESKSHVLSRIKRQDETFYRDVVETASNAVEVCLKDGINKAMEQFNRKPTKEIV
jgi:peptidyl-tRNA hydrolase, PTH1 family